VETRGEKMVKHVKTDTFQKEVLESKIPVLVDFWAKWCGPCLRVAPILDDLSTEVEGRAKIVKVEVDEEYQVADTYEIMSIPTIMIFKDGKIVNQAIGVKSKTELLKLLDL